MHKTHEDIRRKAKLALILRARRVDVHKGIREVQDTDFWGLPKHTPILPGMRKLTEKQRGEFASLTGEERERYFAARDGGKVTHAAAYKLIRPPTRKAAKKAPAKAAPAKKATPAKPEAAEPAKKATKAAKTPPGPSPIADDIPKDTAWRDGRRIYVKAGYRTPLDTQLRAIGAKWDPENQALWVGTGKLERVLPLVRETVEYRRRTAEIKAAGRRVTIPFEAASIRAEAKRLGARWDPDRKQWALPDDESLAKVKALLAEREERERLRREREREDERRRQAEAARQARAAQEERERRIIEQSGRTVIGDPGSGAGVLHGRMQREAAERAKPQPGEVVRLSDGRLALVLSSSVRFYNQDMIDDWLNPVGGTGAEPGWQYTIRYVPVAPTPEDAAREES